MKVQAKDKGRIRIQTSLDRQRAYVVVRAEASYRDVTEIELIDLARSKGLVITDFCREQISQLVGMLQEDNILREPFLIAQGTPATKPTDVELVWDEALKQDEPSADDEDVVNFYQRHKQVTVEGGAVIGQVTPSQPGKDGVDVYGQAAKPKRPPANIRFGENVEFDETTRVVRAKAAGQVIFERGKLSVRSVLEINGHVDFETGNVEGASDVLIRGSVRDLFIVRSKRNISIRGMADSAYLFAGGNITIVGGVKGRGKAIIESGGDVNVKFIDSVYVTCGGDMDVAKEVIDSHIICDGRLDIRNGAIIGGRQFAVAGIRAKMVGSPAAVKTVVGIGCDPRRSRRILDIREKIARTRDVAERIHRNVDPLIAHLKRLTAEQREKATELMYRVTELEDTIKALDKEKEQIFKTLPDPTGIKLTVLARIHSNTEMIIANKYVTIKDEIPGPVNVMLRKVEGVTEMLLINRLTGSSRTLCAQPVGLAQIDLPACPEIAQPGAKPKEAPVEKVPAGA